MSALRLVLAYLRLRPLNTVLNILLLALGLATIVVVLLVTSQVSEKMTQDARGIDLVVGAKGSPLQLILSSVYHIDIPTGNIALREAEQLKKNPMVKRAIPLALGDSFRGFRIVGTEPSYVELYDATLVSGAFWQAPLEAVIGDDVARSSSLVLGSTFAGTHGLSASGGAHNDAPYKVVGILARSNSVLDRLVLTGVESVWAVHKHADEPVAEHTADRDDDRELTALLIQYASPLAAASMPRLINQQSSLQAASPAYEIARLFSLLGIGINTLKAFAAMLIFTAGLGIFIGLSNTLEDRRYDLALLRILGGSAGQLFWLLILEGLILTSIGVAAGLLLGHAVTEALGHFLSGAQQIMVTGFSWVIEEFILVGAALLIGLLAALIPAIRAYRTDIATTLALR